MGFSLKKLLPIAGAAAGYFLGGPAGSAALNAALGSGIGTLVAGGDAKDAVMNAILAGGAGAGLNAVGVAGAGSSTAAGIEAAAAQKAAAAEAAKQAATQQVAQETVKQGIFGTGITGGDIFLGSSLLGLAGVGEEEMEDKELDPKDLESAPDYEGRAIGGLFIDPNTGIAYDTLEELEAAAKERSTNNYAEGGIAAFKPGGYVEGPGNGTSDSIKAGIYQNGKKVQEARLSDKEFVMTNKAVKGAGNGNHELGAKRMYAMMDRFERMA